MNYYGLKSVINIERLRKYVIWILFHLLNCLITQSMFSSSSTSLTSKAHSPRSSDSMCDGNLLPKTISSRYPSAFHSPLCLSHRLLEKEETSTGYPNSKNHQSSSLSLSNCCYFLSQSSHHCVCSYHFMSSYPIQLSPLSLSS